MPQRNDILPPDDKLWTTLGNARTVSVDPDFARRVRRAADSIPQRRGIVSRLLDPLVVRALGGTAIASASIVLLATQFLSAPPETTEAPPSAPALEHGVAALDYVDYFDEILTTEDPSLLSDEDILALLLDDGSSSLLN